MFNWLLIHSGNKLYFMHITTIISNARILNAMQIFKPPSLQLHDLYVNVISRHRLFYIR